MLSLPLLLFVIKKLAFRQNVVRIHSPQSSKAAHAILEQRIGIFRSASRIGALLLVSAPGRAPRRFPGAQLSIQRRSYWIEINEETPTPICGCVQRVSAAAQSAEPLRASISLISDARWPECGRRDQTSSKGGV